MTIFMEVIEWLDPDGRQLVHRIPEEGSADIKMGAQLIVRESQAAVFFRDGKGLDVFGSGRHTLSTLNLPILTKVLSLPWGFTSPFRAEVYFVNLKVFTDLKWGTKEPVAFKDKELGLIRLRAFGIFTVRVTQPLLLINSLVGTQGVYTSDQVEGYLREVIVSRLNDFLGEHVDTIFQLSKQYDEIGVAVKTRLQDDFRRYGLGMIDFFINAITPPLEVQRMIDERSSMAAVGNLDDFMKFKAAKALGDAASGIGAAGGQAAGGLGVGLGAGLGFM
jgi:membrane protease subunit (stomatin/prohibitin family)